MGGPYVIAFLVLFDTVFPIGRQNGGEVVLKTHLTDFEVRQFLGTRLKILEHRFGIHVHIDKDETFPGFAAHRAETYLMLLNTFRSEILGSRQVTNLAIQAPSTSLRRHFGLMTSTTYHWWIQ